MECLGLFELMVSPEDNVLVFAVGCEGDIRWGSMVIIGPLLMLGLWVAEEMIIGELSNLAQVLDTKVSG